MTEKIAGTKIWCLFYRGARLIWVSVLKGLTIQALLVFASVNKVGSNPGYFVPCKQGMSSIPVRHTVYFMFT